MKNAEQKIVIYESPNSTSLEVTLDGETVWLSQEKIAELFGTKRPVITKHLRNIFSEGELDEKSTCSILEHMPKTLQRSYQTKLYNLDTIISVGYRVSSKRATQFRIWATTTLREYLVRGFFTPVRFCKSNLNVFSQFNFGFST